MLKLDRLCTEERTIIDFSRWNYTDAIQLLGHYKYNRVYPHLPPHQHKGIIEICYSVKGEQTYEVESKPYKIKGGDVFITFPDEWHSSDGEPEDRGELFWMLIDVKQAKKNNSFLNFGGELSNAFCDNLLNISKRHFKGTPELKNKLQQLIAFHSKKTLDVLDFIWINHLISGFLLEVISASRNSKNIVNNHSLSKVKNFIEENIEDNFSVAQLADLVNLSESRFKPWFKQQTGLPPLEYVTRKKIYYAKTLLKEEDYPIIDVAYKLGFSSPQYFSKVFKKYTGRKPLEYRRERKLTPNILNSDLSLPSDPYHTY
ncbi:MAG: AraC family transcriptional regulator [Anditalea sp.]